MKNKITKEIDEAIEEIDYVINDINEELGELKQ